MGPPTTEKTTPCLVEAVVVSLRPFQGRPSRHREEEDTSPASFPASTTVAGKWSSSPPPFSFFLCHHPSEHCLVPLSPLRRHSASASSAALQPDSSPPPANVPCSHHRLELGEGGLVAPSRKILFAEKLRSYKGLCTRMVRVTLLCKANRASSKGGCLHTGGSATIPKTRAKMTRSLDRPVTDAEVFRATHTRKRDRSIVEKRADDLLTEFSANLEQATQQAQEEGDESAATVDPDVVWQEHLRRMEEMQRQMAAFYDPLRPRSSAAAGGSGSSAAPPLPPRPPPRHPAPEDGDDDDDYEDA
ncbi:hypothetical protein PIB30_086285 [Stylosanthes scabra]|uniref:Uncharacterized protein n=1 Tax=Stylosanthes scabra TaxID=79078 RepID=A0ABU6QSL2_9FABA|nr:hypothetical protein [Stylosanthes scabra]